jgi:hypothetical protein
VEALWHLERFHEAIVVGMESIKVYRSVGGGDDDGGGSHRQAGRQWWWWWWWWWWWCVGGVVAIGRRAGDGAVGLVAIGRQAVVVVVVTRRVEA